MTLEYGEIFNSFLGYVDDIELFSLDEEDANVFMTEYLEKALSKPYVYQLFSTLDNDRDLMELNFTMSFSENDYTDLYFVKDVLAKGMVVEWAEPKVHSTKTMNQMFAGKEQSFFSQAAHSKELGRILDDAYVGQRKMIRDRGYINNSYLEG